MQIVDAHLDIAYNALRYGRDPLQTVAHVREQETPDFERGTASVSFPQLREAGVSVIFGSLFAAPENSPHMGGDTTLTYRDQRQAHRLAMDQLDYYRRLADDEQSHTRLVTDKKSLQEVIDSQHGGRPLLGIMAAMEGADPIREPEELELWAEMGVRAVGLAWDNTVYAACAWPGCAGGLTAKGMELLEIMAERRLILDLSHMSERACLEALDRYDAPLMASHSNARALVPDERQLSDHVIRRIGEHQGVIGVVLFNSFLRANHQKGDPRFLVTLDHVAAHIDHVCQLLGDARHVGLGSDMDGGFGAEDIPTPMDTIADLPRLIDRLREYGYEEENIARIMGGNWLNLLQDALP